MAEAYVGERLQRIMRRVKNPIAQRRATILLESLLGATTEDLSQRYHLPVPYIEGLITAFNRKGFDAIHEGTRGKAASMCPEERSVMIEVALLTPQAFGLAQTEWNLTQLQHMAMDRGWVRVADVESIRSALMQAGIPFREG